MNIQGSAEWLRDRCGHPTASEFDRILTPKTMKPSASADDYMAEIVADIIRGGPEDIKSFVTKEMERGNLMEPEARRYYTFTTGNEVQQVGHCLSDDGKFGMSPDGLIGLKDGIAEGGLELKCPLGKTHVKYLANGGGLPSDYRCQVHGQLIVGNLKWVDFLSYCSPLPPFLVRVVPDEFTELLKKALADFCVRLDELTAKVRNMS